MRLALLLLVLAASGCAKTSERSEGTESPATVPIEVPVGSDAYSEADSVAADTASG